jgi:hypothetical protein
MSKREDIFLHKGPLTPRMDIKFQLLYLMGKDVFMDISRLLKLGISCGATTTPTICTTEDVGQTFWTSRHK